MIRIASYAAAALLLSSGAALAQSAPAEAGEPVTLTLSFEPGAQTGSILVALFDSEAAYNGGAPVGQATVDVASGQTKAVFANLRNGQYAARAFHDVNGNGKMDTNPFGMPTEPYAFTNNAKGNMGPARWDRAHFDVSGNVEQALDIR